MEERVSKLEKTITDMEAKIKMLEDEVRYTKEFTSTFSGFQGVANKSI